jgi:hypothetical protein
MFNTKPLTGTSLAIQGCALTTFIYFGSRRLPELGIVPLCTLKVCSQRTVDDAHVSLPSGLPRSPVGRATQCRVRIHRVSLLPIAGVDLPACSEARARGRISRTIVLAKAGMWRRSISLRGRLETLRSVRWC